MKYQLLTASLLINIVLLLYACKGNNSTQENPAATANSTSSAVSIDGAWELVRESVGGVERNNEKPSQFKIFHDGFFSLIALDSSGKWSWDGAGTYTLDGNLYKETFQYSSVPEYIGANDWQEYELKGDTLITKGFTKVVFADGKDKTSDYPKFLEKRVRTKR